MDLPIHSNKGIFLQILGVTADNATNMDKMSEHLASEVMSYSSVNRTRCFNHILNLVGRALLKQFDIKKVHATDGSEDLSQEEQDLLDLAQGINDEELTMPEGSYEGDDGDGDREIEPDDIGDIEEIEKWVDEVSSELTEEERQELVENIRPVSRVLVKVCPSRSLTWLRLTGPSASQTGIRARQLNNYPPPRMESVP